MVAKVFDVNYCTNSNFKRISVIFCAKLILRKERVTAFGLRSALSFAYY
jgi:hypothetical protein